MRPGSEQKKDAGGWTGQILRLFKGHVEDRPAPAPRAEPLQPPTPAAAAPIRDAPEAACLVELNGDRLSLPADLVSYLAHVKVSPPDAEVPLFLAETSHYVWIRERLHVGDTALDIGANMGLFTCMMARRVKYGLTGWIHAFEPSPRVCGDLRRVLQANGLDNVVVNQSAVSDKCGKATFYDITTGTVMREASHLSTLGRGDFLGAPGHALVEVDTVTLDSYVAFHRIAPRLVKIDVEGAEFLVLEGGRDCIQRVHPLLVVETHTDANGFFDHARLQAFLKQYGYSYRHDDKTYYCE